MADPASLSDDSARLQFEEWLPWFANATLEPAQHQWMLDYLAAHPGSSAEVHWLEELRKEIQMTSEPPTKDYGLERALGRVRAERKPRIGKFWGSQLPRQFFGASRRSAYAWIAGVVIVAQSMLIFHYHRMLDQFGVAELRAPAINTSSQKSSLIRLTFNAETREEDIRLTIAAIDGRIVGGPGRLGDYYIALDIPIEKALLTLRGKAFVEAAVEVANVPSRD